MKATSNNPKKTWIYNMGYRFLVFYEYGKADFVAFEQ